MYDGLWQDETGQNYDAWSTEGERKETRELIVWIRHEATYSAERIECYRAGGEWGKQRSCPRQM